MANVKENVADTNMATINYTNMIIYVYKTLT